MLETWNLTIYTFIIIDYHWSLWMTNLVDHASACEEIKEMEDEPTEDWKAEVPRSGDPMVPDTLGRWIFMDVKMGCFSNDIGCLNLTPSEREGCCSCGKMKLPIEIRWCKFTNVSYTTHCIPNCCQATVASDCHVVPASCHQTARTTWEWGVVSWPQLRPTKNLLSPTLTHPQPKLGSEDGGFPTPTIHHPMSVPRFIVSLPGASSMQRIAHGSSAKPRWSGVQQQGAEAHRFYHPQFYHEWI